MHSTHVFSLDLRKAPSSALEPFSAHVFLVFLSFSISENLDFYFIHSRCSLLTPGLHTLFPWLYHLPLTVVFLDLSTYAQDHVLNTWFSACETVLESSGNFRRQGLARGGWSLEEGVPFYLVLPDPPISLSFFFSLLLACLLWAAYFLFYNDALFHLEAEE